MPDTLITAPLKPGEGAWHRTDTFPPIGDAIGTPGAGKVVEFVYQRRQAIIGFLAGPLWIARSSRRIYAWGEDTGQDTVTVEDCKTIVNKAQTAVLAQVANHLKEPPKVTIEPTETGEYAPYYWCGPPEVAQEIALDPMYLGGVNPQTGQVFPPLPLPTPLYKQLQADAQADMIDPQFICRLDDEFTAKTLQKELDGNWRDMGVAEWLRAVILDNCVEGWKLPLVEWDGQARQIILNLNSIEATYIDQSYFLMRQSTEAGIDLYLDLDEAMARYPDQRQAILSNPGWISQGGMFPPGPMGTVPVQNKDNYLKPQLRKIVWWMRNQQVGIKAALAAGLVEQRSVPDDQSFQAQGGSDTGAIQGSDEQDNAANPGSNATGDLGAGASGQPFAQPPRQAFFLPSSTTETIPGDVNWPLALRQISIVADTLVEDVICKMPDIPLLHFRNIPVTGRPWGIGEPFNVRNLQKAHSEITNDAVEHAHYNAFPLSEMPQQLKDAMIAEYGKAFLSPKMVIGVPKDYQRADGKPNINVTPAPPFPEWSFKIRDALGEDFNQISGRPDVMTGNSPTDNASGELVRQLQSTAVEPLNFKAQEIQFALEKLAKLTLHCILHFKPRREIAESTSLPEPLLELVLRRARSRTPHIRASINTGSGSTMEAKKSRMIQLNQTIDPATKMPLASGRTARDANGLDAALEDRRNQMAVRESATVLAPLQGQAATASQAQPAPNGNGNGRITG